MPDRQAMRGTTRRCQGQAMMQGVIADAGRSQEEDSAWSPGMKDEGWEAIAIKEAESGGPGA